MKDELFLAVELIGIIAFSISGAVTAYRKQMDLFGIMILGACTALGGGVLRDVLAGERPYVFVKHFYACASLFGALAIVILKNYISHSAAFFVGGSLVVALRLLAAFFHWKLPKPKQRFMESDSE